MSLDDARFIQDRDPHRVSDILAAFPRQCREARALRAEPPVGGTRPGLVVFAGMGGSAAGGDFAAACAFDQLDVPVLVHRGYGLPAAAGARALVIASSYSGETAEALSAAAAALERGAALAVITAGGRLAALARERGVPRVAVPGSLMPRMALGHLFFAGLGVLRDAGLAVATDAELDEALAVVEALTAELAPARPTADNEAKRLARAVAGRLPAVYGGPLTAAAAYRWRTDLEENAKLLALSAALPEMNHNEVEAWRAPDAHGRHAVLLRDAGEPPEVAERFAFVRELVTTAGAGVSECRARGRGRPARLLSLACLGQWVSYYAALERGVDPWAVPVLDELKRRLARVPR
ncbi:MAG: bifunctional phosphoglucose/phosphomannose isomerase [Candidatus Rokubacteria bacterium]|nr:bifunctional phosphoglucose/phosphomannose isomerase [Candidatus Rokubacteria bacterium]